MIKKSMFFVMLVMISSMVLSSCGNAKTALSPTKNTATATMDEGKFPIDVTIDVSTGYSVIFDNDGFLLFDGEYDDSTYPLVTATILTEDVYNKYIADYKDSDDFREDNGFIKYKSSIGESVCLYKIGDEVPFMMTFEADVDNDKADEIIKCMEFDY